MLNSVTGDVDSVSFDVVTPPPTPGVSSALACGTTGDSPSVYDSTNANSPGSTAMTCGAIEAGIYSVGRGAMTTVGGTVRPGRL